MHRCLCKKIPFRVLVHGRPEQPMLHKFSIRNAYSPIVNNVRYNTFSFRDSKKVPLSHFIQATRNRTARTGDCRIRSATNHSDISSQYHLPIQPSIMLSVQHNIWTTKHICAPSPSPPSRALGRLFVRCDQRIRSERPFHLQPCATTTACVRNQ